MPVAVVTGSAGLIGSETVQYFCELGFDVVGIDNDMRRTFFGEEASTAWNRNLLQQRFPKSYRHLNSDVRDQLAIEHLFREYGKHIALVVHAAAQPSHDWAARVPQTDFTVNAIGDHIWYISDTRKFRSHYPEWRQQYDLHRLLDDIYEKNVERWAREPVDVELTRSRR